MEVRKNLGLLEDRKLHAGRSDLGQYSDISSPASSPVYRPGYEPVECNPGLPNTGPIDDRVKDSSFKANADWDNLLESSRVVSDKDVVLAEFALKCKRKKKMDNDMKFKNMDFESKIKTSGSIASNRESTTNQTILVTKPGRASELADSGSAEEAKRTWELSKCLGLYASNDDDVIGALANLHMEKEDVTKRARARGKRGRNRSNVHDPMS